MVRLILRRLRGIAVAFFAWGVVWGISGTGFIILKTAWLHSRGRHPSCFTESFLDLGPLWSVWGAFGALVYCAAMMLGERGRGVAEIPAWRVGLWGAGGGLALPIVRIGETLADPAYRMPTDMGYALAVGALLGAGCAAGALAVARRGMRPVGT